METRSGFRCGERELRVLRLLGKRWTLAILATLAHGPRRFSELANAVPGLSERVMSERLHELCEADLVERQEGARYGLTARGELLRPAMESLLEAALELG